MSEYSTDYTQDNGVGVSIYAHSGLEIVLDFDKRGDHHRSSFTPIKLYQNITVKEAERLREALTNAIKEATK